MLLAAAELMQRVAPTIILLLLFCGCLAFPTKPFLQSHAHNKRQHRRGWGDWGLRGEEKLCAWDIVKSDNSHFFSPKLCSKCGCILCPDKR